MASWCLIREQADAFIKGLRSGEIDPFKLADFPSSESRRSYLSKFVGEENAVHVNALFESKLLLKNRERGFVNWAKKIPGLTSEVKRDLFSKIERMEQILNPKEMETFKKDLASTRLGFETTQDQAKTIFDMSTKIKELKTSFDPKTEKWNSQSAADNFGATQVSLENYLNDLKNGKTLRQMFIDRGIQFKSEYAKNPARAMGKLVLDGAKTIADTSVNLVASFDDSLFGRQGVFTLLSGHPKIWAKAFGKSFVDIVKTFGGKETTDSLKAKLYSDPLYMNGEYKKAGIIDSVEEQFPSSLPERMAGIGKGNKVTNIIAKPVQILGLGFKASEAAFTNGSLRMRTELYKTLRDIKISRGIDITDPAEIKGLGQVVNSLGARGQLGKAGTNPIVRLMMWAPKMLKADLDILTAHSFSDIPKADRAIARGNLLKIVAATVIIEGIAATTNKDNTEFDPRSSNFLQIGGTGFLRGIPQLVTLLSRLISGQYKTTSGEIKNYEPGIGNRSRLDAVYSFLRGKAPPATGAVYDFLAGQDYQGNPPTFTSTLLQRGVAISIQNLIKLSQNPTIDNTFGVIGDFFGLNTNLNPKPNIQSKLIPEGQKLSNEDFIQVVKLYAEALKTDPETAFNRMFTGQRITKVTNGTVMVERMSLKDSQAIKKAQGGNSPAMKLDHTIPLELGGSNDKDNLKLVPTGVWNGYSSVENALGRALKTNKINKQEAQSLIVDFKKGKLSKEAVLRRLAK